MKKKEKIYRIREKIKSEKINVKEIQPAILILVNFTVIVNFPIMISFAELKMRGLKSWLDLLGKSFCNCRLWIIKVEEKYPKN